MQPVFDVSDLSVLIPVYNSRGVVTQAIDNVINQTLKPREIVIVDDGSTDGLCEDFAEIDTLCGASGILFRGDRHSSNLGRGATRNTLLRASTSQLVAWFDVDDLWDPRKLELQLAGYARALDTDPSGKMIATCRFSRVNRHNIFEHIEITPPPRFDLDNLFSLTAKDRNVQLQTTLGPRSEFLRVGGFDARLNWAEDFDFALRYLASGGSFVNAAPHQPMVHYFHGVQGMAAELAIGANKAIIDGHANVFWAHGVDPDAFYQSKYDRYLSRTARIDDEAPYGSHRAQPMESVAARLSTSNKDKRIAFSISAGGDFSADHAALAGTSQATTRLVWVAGDDRAVVSSLLVQSGSVTVPQLACAHAFVNGARYLKIKMLHNGISIDRSAKLYRADCGRIILTSRPPRPRAN